MIAMLKINIYIVNNTQALVKAENKTIRIWQPVGVLQQIYFHLSHWTATKH